MQNQLPRPWTAVDDAELIAARALGFSYEDIRVLLGRPSGPACMHRFKTLTAKAEAAAAAAKRRTRTRACLTCAAPFESEGSHNRMCDGCRESASDVPDYLMDACIVGGRRSAYGVSSSDTNRGREAFDRSSWGI